MKKKIGEILSKNNRRIDIEGDVDYKQVTISRWNKGVKLRKVESGEKIKTKKQFIVRENDFIFCKLNAHSGALGFISKELDGAVVTSDFPSFSLDESVNKDWFEFFISSKEFKEICNSSTSGSAQSRIQIPTFLNSFIEVPSLYEQKLMVRKLKLAKVKYKTIQSTSDALLEDLSAFRKEILNRAFRGELTEQDIADGTGAELLQAIQLERQQQEAETKRKKKTELAPVEAGEVPYDVPESWMWTRLGEVYSMSSGKSIRNKIVHGYPVYGSNGVLGYSSEAPLVKGQRILVGRVGAVGAVHIVEGEYWVSDNTFIVDFQENDISFSWSAILLKYLQLGSYSVATAQPVISYGKIKEVLIPLPPLAEQHRIVEKIEAIFARLDLMEDAIRLQKTEAEACYQEILKTSLSGE